MGYFHVPNLGGWVLAGEPRADDARMLELLEPYRGDGRVVRLLELSGSGRHATGRECATRSIERSLMGVGMGLQPDRRASE